MRIAPIVAVALLIVPVAAYAHPKLVSATPAADSVSAPVSTVQLAFSEPLVAKFSGADIVMTEMPGMKMNAKVPARTAVAADGKTLVLTTAKPLSTGTYKVTYHVVSSDTHRIEGSYSFKVK